MKTEDQIKSDAEIYAQHWLIHAIDKVKEDLNQPDDIPTILEVAFTDGYRTGYMHACDNLDSNKESAK